MVIASFVVGAVLMIVPLSGMLTGQVGGLMPTSWDLVESQTGGGGTGAYHTSKCDGTLNAGNDMLKTDCKDEYGNLGSYSIYPVSSPKCAVSMKFGTTTNTMPAQCTLNADRSRLNVRLDTNSGQLDFYKSGTTPTERI